MEPLFFADIASLVQRRRQLERREFRRLPPAPQTLCLLRLPGEEAYTPAVVQNISVKGIGLLSGRDVPAGTQLELLLVNGSSTFALAVGLHVVRSGPTPAGPCSLGGPFTRLLGHDELVPLMV
jgi:hypothetical protein